jgi:hypothetical protein
MAGPGYEAVIEAARRAQGIPDDDLWSDTRGNPEIWALCDLYLLDIYRGVIPFILMQVAVVISILVFPHLCGLD